MQKHVKKTLQYCMSIVCIISAAACKVPVSDTLMNTDTPAAVTKITLNKTALALVYEESVALVAKIVPADFPQEVVWSVDNSDIITCSEHGVVTAKKVMGTAVVKAAAKTDRSIYAECTVMVSSAKIQRIIPSITAASIALNQEKTFSLRIEPDNVQSRLQYRIEGKAVDVKKFEQHEDNTGYTGIITGRTSGKSTLHFFSETDPSVSADIEITVTAPPVQEIILEDTTIFLGDTNAAMPLSVKPAHAVPQVKWSSSSPHIAAIDENTGSITPKAPGTTVITASSVHNAQCSGKALLTVKPSTEKKYSVELSAPFVAFNRPAELVIQPAAAYAAASFIVTSDSPDICISKDESNPYRFIIEAADKNMPAGAALLKIIPEGNSVNYVQTVKLILKSLIPASLTIIGPESMYKDETIDFSVQAPHADSEADCAVFWSAECANPLFEAGKWVALDNGQLSINNAYKTRISHGEKLIIRAVSQLDAAVIAEKAITVYDSIARVKTVDCDMSEYTIGDTQKPSVRITFENEDTAYKHFWITEYADGFRSSYLTQTVYELSNEQSTISLSCRLATAAKQRDFFILPIDPKTNKPVTNIVKKSFLLSIWGKFERIVLEKGNFAIKKDVHNTVNYTLAEEYLAHNKPNNSFHFFIKQEASNSKPVEITVKASHGTDVVHSLISEQQPDGRIKVSFGTQKSKIGISERETIVCTGGGKQIALKIAIN